MFDQTSLKISAKVDASAIDQAASRWERAAQAIGQAVGKANGGGQNPNTYWNPNTNQYHDRDTGQFVPQPRSRLSQAASYGANFASSAAKQMGFVGVGGMAAGDIYGARQSIAQGSQIEALSKSFGNTADALNTFKENLLNVTKAYGVNYQELTKFTDALKAGGGARLSQPQATRNAASIFSLQNSGLYSMQAGYGLQTDLLQGGGGANMNVINAQVAASLRMGGTSMSGRGDELVSSVQSLVDQLQTQGGATGNVDTQFGKMASLMGVMAKSGVPGLMGSAGAGQIQQAGQAEQGGLGFALTLQGLSDQGRAPSSLADYTQLKQQALDPSNIQALYQGMSDQLGPNASAQSIRDMTAMIDSSSGANLSVANSVPMYNAMQQYGSGTAQQQAMVQAIGGITDTSKQGNALDLLQGSGDQSGQLKAMLKQAGLSDDAINKLVNGSMTGEQAANVYAQNINNSATAAGDTGTFQDAQRSVEDVITGFVQAGKELVSSVKTVADTVQKMQGLQSGPLHVLNSTGALPAIAQVGMWGGAIWGGAKIAKGLAGGVGNVLSRFGGGATTAAGNAAGSTGEMSIGALMAGDSAAGGAAGGADAVGAAGAGLLGVGMAPLAVGAGGLLFGASDIASDLKHGNTGGALTTAGWMAGGATAGMMLGGPMGAAIGGGAGAGVGWLANNTSLFDGIGGMFGMGPKKKNTGKAAAPANTDQGSLAPYGATNMSAQNLQVGTLSLASQDLSQYYHNAIQVKWQDDQMTVLAQRIAQYNKAAGVGNGNGTGKNSSGTSTTDTGTVGDAQKDILKWSQANASKLGADPNTLAQMEMGLNYYETGGSTNNPFQFSNDLAAQYGTNGSASQQLNVLAGMGRVGDAYQAYVQAGGGAAGLQAAENIQEIPNQDVERQRGPQAFQGAVSSAASAFSTLDGSGSSTPAAASPAAASAAASTATTASPYTSQQASDIASALGMSLSDFNALSPADQRAAHDKALAKYPKLDQGSAMIAANTAAAGQGTDPNGSPAPASAGGTPADVGQQAHDAWLKAHPGDYDGADTAGTNAANAAAPAAVGSSIKTGSAALIQGLRGSSAGSNVNVVVNGKVTVDLGSLGSYDLPVQGAGQANDAALTQPTASNY